MDRVKPEGQPARAESPDGPDQNLYPLFNVIMYCGTLNVILGRPTRNKVMELRLSTCQRAYLMPPTSP